MRPFLKWAGGKLRIVERIKAALPPGKRLIEPFVGSGAIFLNTDYRAYLLADTNADLINTYWQLCAHGARFIADCRRYFTSKSNTSGVYYEYRARFNATVDLYEKSALFIYLNKHGYNGLCRYNSRGLFNVPFGRFLSPHFPEAEMLAFQRKAESVDFRIGVFTATMTEARPGDVIYCDPPYAPLSATANFTSYSAKQFGPSDQECLASMAADLAALGITVVISNHDTPYTRTLYAGATERTYFAVRRNISRDSANRNAVQEVLAVYRANRE